jgi:hypothetical protein
MENWTGSIPATKEEAIALLAPQGIYHFECWRRPDACDCHGCGLWAQVKAGVVEQTEAVTREMQCTYAFLAWEEHVHNLVFDAGINELLDKFFKGSSYTATWYVFLVDNASFSAYAAGDTMASHSGWLEGTPYSNANRPTLTLGTVASKSVDNSASKASFTINATLTVRGAGIANNNTKGGTTGIAYGAADFGASRAVISGDTLNVQVTLTGA